MESVLAVPDPKVIVLAEGETTGAQSNAKGHLFEEFVGRVFELYGYESPTREKFNVTENGIELDLVLRHKLSGEQAIVECKSYSSPVKSHQLAAFYGKYSARRRKDPTLRAFFVALPRLVSEGVEFATSIKDDRQFRVMIARDVLDAMRDKGVVPIFPETIEGLELSDRAVLVTPYGLLSAAYRIDRVSRVATGVIVASSYGEVSGPAMNLVASSPYAEGLPVLDARGAPEPGVAVSDRDGRATSEALLVTVKGGKSDFEYQLPASPKHFVGQARVVGELEELVRAGSGIVVFNAKSGSGKSSLALKLQQLAKREEGHSVIFDSRTASDRQYVPAALSMAMAEAERHGLLKLPPDASWASTASAIRTIAAADWFSDSGPLVIFFDQFETVFRSEVVTREFRDLALGISEINRSVILGFAWKTDYISWTEGHPYRFRDEIRNSGRVLILDPLGARELETLLRRLEKAAGVTLGRELKQRLREVSQGLPWLFKKLSGHVLQEIRRGTKVDDLVSEALNVQGLFESDLAELSPQERSALTQIASFAPLDVAVAMDKAPRDIIQSLLDRRLIVQVGEKLDTYWDIFRDFLITGRVPIEDAYILRMGPTSASRLLRYVEYDGGDSFVPDVARGMQTSENVVWNRARDVRLLSLIVNEPNRVKFSPDLLASNTRERLAREKVAVALRRHKAYSILLALIDQAGGRVSVATFARQLAQGFPAVSVAATVWANYARSFLAWFDYAELAEVEGGEIRLAPEGFASSQFLFDGQSRIALRGVFPAGFPSAAEVAVSRVSVKTGVESLSRTDRGGYRDLVTLGALVVLDGVLCLHSGLVKENGSLDPLALRRLIAAVRGGAEALALLEADPAASPKRVGRVLQSAHSASDWSEGTIVHKGKMFRAWARSAGVDTKVRAANRPE